MSKTTKIKGKLKEIQEEKLTAQQVTELRSCTDENSRKAKEKIQEALMVAVGEQTPARVFFTTCALQLETIARRDIPTMSTDGRRIYYNPEFTLSLTPQEIHGVLCGHEPAHCFMDHFARGSAFTNHTIANLAMDLEINPMLQEAGYKLPDSACFPGEGMFAKLPKGDTFENYYKMLHDMISKLKDKYGEGLGGDDPGGCGGIMRPSDDAEAAEVSQRWREIVASAAQEAQSRGSIDGFLKRAIDNVLKPKYNPWDHLQMYLTKTAKADVSWSRLNRRHLARNIYLPGRHSPALGELVIMFDLSGSITDEQARMMGWVMQSAMERMPGKLTILYHDIPVHRVQEWEPGDEELKFESTGGGGTSHLPAFQAVTEMGLEPELILAVTDMYTEFPPSFPFPTLWLNTVASNITPPFGDVINLV